MIFDCRKNLDCRKNIDCQKATTVEKVKRNFINAGNYSPHMVKKLFLKNFLSTKFLKKL